MKRTNYCGLINENYLNKNVTINGWIHKRRDLGGLIFIDVIDREGIIQVVVKPEDECFKIASLLKNDYVIEVNGIVSKRSNPNKDIKTGALEINAISIEILNTAIPAPIIADDVNTSETNRLIHRVIDLRSQKMHKNIMLRHKVTHYFRDYLDNNGYIDIETPILTASTPSGARDYVVPSRVHKGQFFALPQSPQVFKQLLMVSGFDKYYQVAKCFRDEDLRSDRQPEFTQIDIEASFVNEVDIIEFSENLIKHVFRNVLNIELEKFPIISYNEAMEKYGSDKPDLRIPLEFTDLTSELSVSSFQIFKDINNLPNGGIIALKLPKEIALSRKEIDNYTESIKNYGLKGLIYLKINDINSPNEHGLQSPIVKFLNESELKKIIEKTKANNNDMILILAGELNKIREAMNHIRLHIAQSKNFYSKKWAPLWVKDFPMFEMSEDKQLSSCHHPFTSPKDEHVNILKSNPIKALAKAYDMVLNGSEIAGGSIRIHSHEIQELIFSILNISKEEAEHKFGFLLNNLQYGAPPHGGIAFGLDRISAIICESESIREVIAFPKTTTAQCLLTNAPTHLTDKQLHELGIKISK